MTSTEQRLDAIVKLAEETRAAARIDGVDGLDAGNVIHLASEAAWLVAHMEKLEAVADAAREHVAEQFPYEEDTPLAHALDDLDATLCPTHDTDSGFCSADCPDRVSK